MGLSANKLELQKAKKIQMQQIPKQLIETLPIITFYKLPSGKDLLNSLVYNAIFMFDTYTQNDVELAHLIAKELYKIFDEEYLDIPNVGTFRGEWLDGYESATNDPDTYCFTNLIAVSIALEEK